MRPTLWRVAAVVALSALIIGLSATEALVALLGVLLLGFGSMYVARWVHDAHRLHPSI